ncbi:unknown [Prevotella sp. CAG:1031]|nr:unknown [Prevotella sp. CAG:1031]
MSAESGDEADGSSNTGGVSATVRPRLSSERMRATTGWKNAPAAAA